MILKIELVLLPEEAADKTVQLEKAAAQCALAPDRLTLRILKRSIDARSRQVKIRLQAEVYVDEFPPPLNPAAGFDFQKDVSSAQPVLIIGSGPAGLFAALRLIELGLKPVLIERGKEVQQRRRDLAAINRNGMVNPDSNYCFGEGGAGTYSDGKLYTRSTKRGDVNRIINILVTHGADPDILVDAHPHIGTNRLPRLIEALRKTILNAGGEFFFNRRVKDFILREKKIRGVLTEETLSKREHEMTADAVILATGHSAADIYELFHERQLLIHAKPYALGVRIEHPQALIDSIQYHCATRNPWLPAASYTLAEQVGPRGVYSFCMCPGGIIAPAATSPGEVVVNGWSPSKRNNPFANSGLVVSVDEKDFGDFSAHGALAGLRYREHIERKTFEAGGKNLAAPAQRLIDFVDKKISHTLPVTSYLPGVRSVQLRDVLPQEIHEALHGSLKSIPRKMPGYYTNEAVLVAVESRTSSPVRIPRSEITLQHPEAEGLFPCGEGAGYAGGIVSAAIDGERCAEQACALMKQ